MVLHCSVKVLGFTVSSTLLIWAFFLILTMRKCHKCYMTLHTGTNQSNSRPQTWQKGWVRPPFPRLPVAALTGVLGESMLSRWMDFGRPRLCLAPVAGRGLMTVSMSSISLSCFLLRYSCLMNSFLALSSSFLMRSSSAFILRESVPRNTVRAYNLKKKLIIHCRE